MTALDIARRSGMAYFGATTLAALARTEPNPQTRRRMIDETEELLSTVAVSHNHWFGRRELIELGWELRDPQMIEFHASALDAYTTKHELSLFPGRGHSSRPSARARFTSRTLLRSRRRNREHQEHRGEERLRSPQIRIGGVRGAAISRRGGRPLLELRRRLLQFPILCARGSYSAARQAWEIGQKLELTQGSTGIGGQLSIPLFYPAPAGNRVITDHSLFRPEQGNNYPVICTYIVCIYWQICRKPMK